jgi:hypothetical protein
MSFEGQALTEKIMDHGSVNSSVSSVEYDENKPSHETRLERSFISFEARRQRSSGETAAEFRRNSSRVPVKQQRSSSNGVPTKWGAVSNNDYWCSR